MRRIKSTLFAGLVGGLMFAATGTWAGDLDLAPPSWRMGADLVVPIDVQLIETQMTFDVAAGSTRGHAVMHFNNDQAGFPMFDVVGTVSKVVVDGEEVNANDLITTADPDRVTNFRVLKRNLAAGSHQVAIDYTFTEGVTYETGAVRAGFFMDDLGAHGRGFWEQYGPSNFEFDHFKQTLQLSVVGTTSKHRLFTNGDIAGEQTGLDFFVEFPEYFTTSSFYVHLVKDGRFQVVEKNLQGIAAQVPVTVYAVQRSDANQGMAKAEDMLAELEETYGAFAHKKIVIYVTPTGGGMEYCGATMTSIWAIEHELTHSYFARSVMPANGNAGWIDEAIASWRDDGYPRSSGAPNLAVTNMGNHSVYRRHTNSAAYTHGADLLAGFDFLFKNVQYENQSGLKAVLRQLFQTKKNQSITVQFFQNFLQDATALNLTPYFNKYVFGLDQKRDDDLLSYRHGMTGGMTAHSIHHHPRPYSRAERIIFR